MSTDLVPQTAQPVIAYGADRFELEQRMAKLFAMSGLFKDIAGTSQEQAIAQSYVKIALGGSMGFSPAESMQGIDIIQGRPSVGSQLRAARMQRAGYSWRIDRLDNTGCELTIFAGAKEIGKAAFTKEDATSAGVINKDNWKKDPSSMYFARAITRAQRRYAPGVLSLDIVSSEEAIDIPEPSSLSAAVATESKTEKLEERLTQARERKAKPEPKAEADPRDLEWQKRLSGTFFVDLGEAEFRAIIHSVTGSEDLHSVTAANVKEIWGKMEEAKKKYAAAEPVPPLNLS